MECVPTRPAVVEGGGGGSSTTINKKSYSGRPIFFKKGVYCSVNGPFPFQVRTGNGFLEYLGFDWLEPRCGRALQQVVGIVSPLLCLKASWISWEEASMGKAVALVVEVISTDPTENRAGIARYVCYCLLKFGTKHFMRDANFWVKRVECLLFEILPVQPWRCVAVSDQTCWEMLGVWGIMCTLDISFSRISRWDPSISNLRWLY